jgi:hypothetical protein
MAGVDLERCRSELETQLPLRVRWLLHRGEPLAFDFSRARKPLRRLEPSDIGGDPEQDWSGLWLFGEYDYSDGGGASGYVGVHEGTGVIHGLDVERSSSPMFFYNSDAGAFVRTFAAFNEAFRRGEVDSDSLSIRANEVDGDGFRRSEWRSLIEYLRKDPH